METKLTSRIGALPDTWSFIKQDFASEKANLNNIMFGSSEYIKDGLFYNAINLKSGKIVDKRMSDNFGYNLNAYYTVYLVDVAEKYRDAALKTLGSLKGNYEKFLWEGSSGTGSADGYADAIEGAINIFNREAVPGADDWIDSEIQEMWTKQQESGIIEGWHGDGNFARTTLIYCLWKTQGVTIEPWREDVKFGAVAENGKIYLSIEADSEWEGKIIFDTPRHKTNLNMPFDWPRINQIPEWFTVEKDQNYKIKLDGQTTKYTGSKMSDGINLQIAPGQNMLTIY